MPDIIEDPSQLERECQLPERHGSWRTSAAMLEPPCAAFVTTFVVLCARDLSTSGRSPLEMAFVFSGLPLYGPFARGIVVDLNWTRDATVAWGVLLIVSLIVRHTPIGKWHWLVHGVIAAAWFVVIMIVGGLAIT